MTGYTVSVISTTEIVWTGRMTTLGKHGQLKPAIKGLVFEVRSAAIWVQMRLGVQAALCAKPEDVENCKPKTELGKVVRGLVVEACKGRSTAMKTLLRFLEYVEDEEIAALQRTLPDIEWDWTPDGVWLTKPEAVEEEQVGEGEGRLGARAKRPRPSSFTTEELSMSRQQRRYLARLHEKKTARPDAVPTLS